MGISRLRLRHPSPALIVACLALFAALGGTTYAATRVTRTNYRGPARGAASRATVGGTNRRQSPTVVRHQNAPAAPTTPVTVHHLSLAASAFAPDGLHNTSEDYFNMWDPTTLSNSDAARCFNVGLTPPDDATLRSVTIYYTQGTEAPLYFEINRQDLVNHTSRTLVSFQSAQGATATYMATTESIPSALGTIHYGNDAYSAGVCPDADSTFSGMRLTYTTPAPTP